MNELPKGFCARCHADMKRSGFWDDYYAALGQSDEKTARPNELAFIGQKIALVHDEISELWECQTIDCAIEELADVFLRLADIAGFFGIEFSEEMVHVDDTENVEVAILDLSVEVSHILRSIRKNDSPTDQIIFAMQMTIGIAEDLYDVNLRHAIVEKAEKNRQRQRKHGKAF